MFIRFAVAKRTKEPTKRPPSNKMNRVQKAPRSTLCLELLLKRQHKNNKIPGNIVTLKYMFLFSRQGQKVHGFCQDAWIVESYIASLSVYALLRS